MLPYIAQPVVRVGPISIYLFGVLVSLAVLVGGGVARRRASKAGLAPPLMDDLLVWTLVGGFLAGHLLDEIFYFPGEIATNPTRLLRPWDGLSSFGGFVGGIAGAMALLARRRFAGLRWEALDALAYGFPFGWVFGRLGCFVAFDHPGIATHFVLGERYVDGVVRHNLGLEESLCVALVAALFWGLGRSARPAGFFVGLLAVLYAPMRFGLDSLRIDDARYFGWTPAQYGAVLLLFIGIGALTKALVAPRRGAFDAARVTPGE